MPTDRYLRDEGSTPWRKDRAIAWLIGLVALGSTCGLLGSLIYTRFSEAKGREQDYRALLQIGMALHNYHEFQGVFPPGSSFGVNHFGDHPPEKGHSWMVRLLPYLEQNNLYQGINLAEPWDSLANSQIASVPYNFFNGTRPKTNESPYVGIAGVGRDAAELESRHPNVGVFGYRRATRIADITDGLKNTIMVVETSNQRGPWMSGGPATVRGLDPDRPPYLGAGGQFGGKGGGIALYADGSVRWLSKRIDPKVFEALATIHGGEPVPEEFQAVPSSKK